MPAGRRLQMVRSICAPSRFDGMLPLPGKFAGAEGGRLRRGWRSDAW